jgi:hypothetical protein
MTALAQLVDGTDERTERASAEPIEVAARMAAVAMSEDRFRIALSQLSRNLSGANTGESGAILNP